MKNKSLFALCLMLAIAFCVPATFAAAPKAAKKAEVKVDNSAIDAKVLNAFNKFDAKELKKITGISKNVAEHIVKHRKKTPFKTIEDIKKLKVDGKLKFKKTKKGTAKGFKGFIGKVRFYFSEEILDINTATKAQLTCVPKISGPTAKAIIEYRKKTPFKKIDELLKLKSKKGKFIFQTKKGKPNKKFKLASKRLEVKAAAPAKPAKPAKK
jgi:DNA uptake protein ComE-like DNA-binding protein